MRVLISLATCAVVWLLLSGSGEASIIALTPATPGLTFTIEDLGLAPADLYTADGVDDTHRLQLTLTTTTDYVNAGTEPDLLAAFALELGSGNVQAATLVSAPPDYSWTLLAGEKVPGNSAKCDGNGGASLCVEATASATNNLVLDANATYNWVFDVDLGGASFSDAIGLDVAAGTLKKTGPSYMFHGTRTLSSDSPSSPGAGDPVPPLDPATPVPEPGSLILFGSGLMLASGRFRRRRG
jgi:hypothetical protein